MTIDSCCKSITTKPIIELKKEYNNTYHIIIPIEYNQRNNGNTFSRHHYKTVTTKLSIKLIKILRKITNASPFQELLGTVSQGIRRTLPAVGDGVLEVPLRVGGLSMSNLRLDAGRRRY